MTTDQLTLTVLDAPASSVPTPATRHDQARAEERAARQDAKRRAKLDKGAAAYRARKQRDALQDAIRDTRERWPRCRCQLRGIRTIDELQALGAGCTAPGYVCPRLDTIRRRLGR